MDKVLGKFVTLTELLEIQGKEFSFRSSPDSSGYYRSYWILDNNDLVYTVQNIYICFI